MLEFGGYLKDIILAHHTNDLKTDDILKGFISFCELLLPDSIAAYYLSGSRSDNTAVASSDIDLIIIENQPFSQDKVDLFMYILHTCNRMSSIEIGFCVFSQDELNIGVPAYVKSALFLYGKDILANIPIIDNAHMTNTFVYGAFRFLYHFLRDSHSTLTFPLNVPDKTKDFNGYLEFKKNNYPKTKILVNATARITSALLGIKKNIQPRNKSQSIKLFVELFNCEYTELVNDIYENVYQKWSYDIPKNENEIQKLKTICDTFILFENYFLDEVHPYIVENLRSQDSKNRENAKKCLNMISYNDKKTIALLNSLKV